jgi:hypothetical protein
MFAYGYYRDVSRGLEYEEIAQEIVPPAVRRLLIFR